MRIWVNLQLGHDAKELWSTRTLSKQLLELAKTWRNKLCKIMQKSEKKLWKNTWSTVQSRTSDKVFIRIISIQPSICRKLEFIEWVKRWMEHVQALTHGANTSNNGHSLLQINKAKFRTLSFLSFFLALSSSS